MHDKIKREANTDGWWYSINGLPRR
jgi:hypothetical protein